MVALLRVLPLPLQRLLGPFQGFQLGGLGLELPAVLGDLLLGQAHGVRVHLGHLRELVQPHCNGEREGRLQGGREGNSNLSSNPHPCALQSCPGLPERSAFPSPRPISAGSWRRTGRTSSGDVSAVLELAQRRPCPTALPLAASQTPRPLPEAGGFCRSALRTPQGTRVGHRMRGQERGTPIPRLPGTRTGCPGLSAAAARGAEAPLSAVPDPPCAPGGLNPGCRPHPAAPGPQCPPLMKGHSLSTPCPLPVLSSPVRDAEPPPSPANTPGIAPGAASTAPAASGRPGTPKTCGVRGGDPGALLEPPCGAAAGSGSAGALAAGMGSP